MIQDWDQYGVMPHNYYLYANPADGDRLVWIPWDHSLSMREGRAPSLALDEISDDWPLIRFLLDDPVYAMRCRALVAEAVGDGAFAPAVTEARLHAAHALIAPYVVGPEGELPGHTFLASSSAFDAALDELIAHAHARAAAVTEFLAR